MDDDQMIELVEYGFGPESQDRVRESGDPGHVGAVAALESFYFALNNADLDALAANWSPNRLVQLNNPLGGILRGGAEVTELYRGVFSGGLRVQVTFTDTVAYWGQAVVVFAGLETGSYHDDDIGVAPLEIRTTRVFGYDEEVGRWLQLHHHGSIDRPEALLAYQLAAERATTNP
jgi:ketosteroid isomerase-like protein